MSLPIDRSFFNLTQTDILKLKEQPDFH